MSHSNSVSPSRRLSEVPHEHLAPPKEIFWLLWLSHPIGLIRPLRHVINSEDYGVPGFDTLIQFSREQLGFAPIGIAKQTAE